MGFYNMDWADIASAIGTIGFPTVMCLLFWKKMDKQDEQHENEMNKVMDALNNNTKAMTELSLRLEYSGALANKNSGNKNKGDTEE